MNDPVDEPFAQRIQEELTARGGQKVDAADESARIVLVLSNRTHLAWLDALETELRDKDLITVVVTAIGLSPTLSWLWKRQWIDFADAGQRTIASGGRPCRYPRRWIEHEFRSGLLLHIICGTMAGLGLVAANIVADAQQSDLDTLGHVNRHIHRFVSVACMEICRAPRFAASFQHLADRCMECSDAFMRCAVYSLF